MLYALMLMTFIPYISNFGITHCKQLILDHFYANLSVPYK